MLLWKMAGVAGLVVFGTLAVNRELTLGEYGWRWMEGVDKYYSFSQEITLGPLKLYTW